MVLMDKADVEALLTTIKAKSAQSLVAVSQPTMDDGQYHPGTKGAWQAAAVVTPASNDTSSDSSTDDADYSSAADASATTASERRSLFRNSKGEASTRQAALSRGASNKTSSVGAASQGQVSSIKGPAISAAC